MFGQQQDAKVEMTDTQDLRVQIKAQAIEIKDLRMQIKAQAIEIKRTRTDPDRLVTGIGSASSSSSAAAGIVGGVSGETNWTQLALELAALPPAEAFQRLKQDPFGVAGIKKLNDRPKCADRPKFQGLIVHQHISKCGGTSTCKIARNEYKRLETIYNCYGPWQLDANQTDIYLRYGCVATRAFNCSFDPVTKKPFETKNYNLTHKRLTHMSTHAKFIDTIMMVSEPRKSHPEEKGMTEFLAMAKAQGLRFYQNEWKPFIPVFESTLRSASSS
jgi:hypothetical protein